MTRNVQLSPEARRSLVEAAEVRAGLRAPSAKGMFEPSPFGALRLLRHPSGMIVHGPGATDVIREAQGEQSPTGSDLVAALIRSLCRAYAEPQWRVWRGPYFDLKRAEPVEDHQANALLRRPNPDVTARAIRQWVRAWIIADGNAYLVKIRGGGGSVTENTTGPILYLRRGSPQRIKPHTEKGSGDLITEYHYDIGKSRPLVIPRENIVHFRDPLDDPLDPRLGYGAVKEFARKVTADKAVDDLVLYVLLNSGVPGLLIKQKPPKGRQGQRKWTEDEKSAFRNDWIANTTGDQRGMPTLVEGDIEVDQFEFSFDGIDLTPVLRNIETRASGAIGWPAILAGLSSGLDSATYSNARQLQEFATEQVLVPILWDDAETMALQLVEATHAGGVAPTRESSLGLADDEWIAPDVNSMRALQTDELERRKATREDFAKNLITLGQAHEELDRELPGGVDPNLRFADIAAAAAPMLPPGAAKILDAVRYRALPWPELNGGRKAVEPFVPDDTELDGDLSDIEITPADDEELAAAWDAYAADEEPELVGMFSGNGDEPEEAE